MAKKTPRKKRKSNTLDAISGTDAIEVLRILANRDKELSKEIDAIAKDLLADVSLDEVADCVQAELESLAVEDVWDRSGARRDGYVDPGETAWQMFEAALEPFREDMLKYQQLSMLEQAEAPPDRFALRLDCLALNTTTHPSRTRRHRSTSAVKSTCPGVSSRLKTWSFQGNVTQAE